MEEVNEFWDGLVCRDMQQIKSLLFLFAFAVYEKCNFDFNNVKHFVNTFDNRLVLKSDETLTV